MTLVFTTWVNPKRLTATFFATAACLWLSTGTAHAQIATDPSTPARAAFVADASQPVGIARSVDVPHGIRHSIATHSERAAEYLHAATPAVPPAQPNRERSGWRRFAGAAVGATAGFFAGGYIGAAIDGDCGGCDDPGLKGALIGMPIGALLGGIAGGLWLF